MNEWTDLKEKFGILFFSVILHNEVEQNMPLHKCASLAGTLVWAEGNRDPADSEKLFASLLTA